MRAARFHSFGGPEVLVVEEAPVPHAGDGAIRVRVQATSVNPIDLYVRAGALQTVYPVDLPAIPGRDAVGIVDEIGPGVTGVTIGDRVFGLGGISDTTAEYAVLTAWSSTPESWSTNQAAAAGLATATAAAVVEALGDLTGRTVLVDGASGAVGSAAAAFALAAGATVIGTGGERNQEFLQAMGVVPTTYGPGLTDRITTLAPQGVDVAVHSARSDSLAELAAIAGDPSAVVTVVDKQGAATIGARAVDARNDSALLDLGSRLGRDGRYTPRVDRVVALTEIVDAHRLAASGAGKVVVTVS